MAAGQGYIEFATGDVLTAASANGYLASQVVMVFASAAARTSAIASPQEGMISYLKDTNSTEYYSGSAWVAIGGASAPAFVGCRLNKSGTQSFANSTDTAVTWDVEQFDTDAFHSTSTNTSRITIPTGKGGKYLFNARMLWATQAGGSRELKFFKNGSEVFWMPMALAPTQTGAAYTTFLEVAAADYLEVYAWQNSGSAVSNIAGLSSEFSAQYLGA